MGSGGGKRPSDAQIVGSIIGGVINAAAEADRRRRYEERFSQPTTRTVVVQAPSAPAQIPVQVGTTRVAEPPKVTLAKNTTAVTAKPATKEVVNKAKNALNKTMGDKLETFLDSLEDATMTEDKANALAQKWLDEGKDKKQISDFLNAINNGDEDIAGKLASDLTGDPLEGSKIAKAVKLGRQLSELQDSVQNGEFGTQDFADLKKLIDRANLPAKSKKSSQRILAGLKDNLKLLEILTAFKDLSKTVIPAPTTAVTVIYCPSIPSDAIYAVDTETYMVKGNEFSIEEEDISDAFLQIPVYANPVPQSTSTTPVNQCRLVNSSGRTATYRLEDNTSRTLEQGQNVSFPVTASGTISVSSQGRWKSFSVGTGTYKLDYSGGAWSVVVEAITVTLDNYGNPLPFYCFVDGTEQLLNPGEQVTFNSENGVIEIQFARNEDTRNRAVYQFENSATYKIGLNQTDGKLALFP
jgi:hypothetical protein